MATEQLLPPMVTLVLSPEQGACQLKDNYKWKQWFYHFIGLTPYTALLRIYVTERKRTGVVVVVACDDVSPDVVGADVVGAKVVLGCGVDGADEEVVVRDGSCVVVGPAVVVGPTVVVIGCGVVPV